MRSLSDAGVIACRGLLLLAVLLSPWLFASYPLWCQQLIWWLIAATSVSWLITSALSGAAGRALSPSVLLALAPVLALAGFGIYQSIPGLPGRGQFEQIVHPEALRIALDGAFTDSNQTISRAPHLTRLYVCRLVGVFAVIVLGAELFSSRSARRILWICFATTGVVLSVFGIVQKATWNGQLFWSIPLQYGGQPFASFVNRNTAAGFLNLCAAATLAWVACELTERRRSSQHRFRVLTDVEPNSRAGLWISCLFLGITCGGVISTTSRGGSVALAVALGFTLVVLAFQSPWRRMSVIGLGTVATAIFIASGTGVLAVTLERFAWFETTGFVGSGRLQHWRDMLPAIKDFGSLGAGLGTYRYVHMPYQSQLAPGRYWNADNQYLDWLIEGGWPVAGVIALGILVWAGATLVAFIRGRRSPELVGDLGPLCLMGGIAPLVQSVTDFGLSMPSNMLAAALLTGAATGGLARATEVENDDDIASTPPGFILPVLLALSLAIASSAAELGRAADAQRFCQRIKILLETSPQSLSLSSIDGLLSEASPLLNAVPQDPELLHEVASLWRLRYQFQVWRTLNDEHARLGLSADDSLWGRASPLALDAICVNLLRQGRTAELDELRKQPLVAGPLQSAYKLLQDCRQACEPYPGADFECAQLALICGDSAEQRRRFLYAAVAFDPSNKRLLKSVAAFSGLAVDDLLGAMCWRRIWVLDPSVAGSLMFVLLQQFDELFVLNEIVPPTPEAWLTFADHCRTAGAKAEAARRIEAVLATESESSTSEVHARLAQLQGRHEQAAMLYRQMIEHDPLSVDARVRLAQVLVELNDPVEAVRYLEQALHLEPQRAEAQRLLDRLHRRPSARNPSAP